jgi:hypothetical protein
LAIEKIAGAAPGFIPALKTTPPKGGSEVEINGLSPIYRASFIARGFIPGRSGPFVTLGKQENCRIIFLKTAQVEKK